MLEITNLQTYGWEAAIRGMRNPMNSWAKSDSVFYTVDNVAVEERYKIGEFSIGPNDLDLAYRLIKAGPEHAKFLRMIHVQMDINSASYWWKEMDTYKISSTANSTSTMHKITSRKLTIDDFSHEHLTSYNEDGELCRDWLGDLEDLIDEINFARVKYLETKDKKYWWQIIQLLPFSYNYLRTWDASLQTVLTILHQRKGHKLDEWHTFRRICFEQIPYCKEFYTVMTGDNDYETC